MSNDIPDPDEVSIPSSVKKAGAEARIAQRVANDYTHNDELRQLMQDLRRMAHEKSLESSTSRTLEFCARRLESVMEDNSQQ